MRAAISHVIFDMDGVLLDTEGFYSVAQERILARFGKVFDPSVKAKLIGKQPLDSSRIFVQETGLSGLITPAAFHREREAMLRDLFPTCQLLPGVERLINHLHENRIPMCIGTGSDKQRFELLTQKHGAVFSKIHHVVAGDDPEVKNGKPSPDIFLTASERYEDNVEPSKILVFEDAPSGVAAAKSAGMWVIKLPSPEMDAVYHNDADQTLSSLVDFQPENWGLPPFQDVDL